ncbi:MAG: hypothetical protein COV52_06090 [Gammaproteobacteria bacterium CG11_big_fil_rev_8_21_14_0_20_46_22]|nr:MAG: hypothetical protein COW05_07570 [Gammaproteobacteria bacterium CG12_big_fil_rev_8_21_14_0_65_46_12]PIR11072.1 MAG: hypothetical protein COV52_06090 [Gammaproteobacteria bacterium CG11_big_fil_rev_8_21_14_0_20_46_22]
MNKSKTCSLTPRFHIDIESLLFLPMNVFVQSKDNEGLACNDQVAEMIGLKNRHDFEGLSYRAMAKIMGGQYQQYRSFRQDDLLVMKNNKPLLNKSEPTLYSEAMKKDYYFITNRFPLYDQNGHIEATLGIAFEVPYSKIDQSLTQVKALLNALPSNTLNPEKAKPRKNPLNNLTQREQQVVYLVLKGKTLKAVAKDLRLSPRTVETYFDNAKQKLGYKTKSELIQQLLA